MGKQSIREPAVPAESHSLDKIVSQPWDRRSRMEHTLVTVNRASKLGSARFRDTMSTDEANALRWWVSTMRHG